MQVSLISVQCILHGCIEDYVNDIVVMSKVANQHINDQRKVFLGCRQYNLKMNPLKHTFGVSSGKFLGFSIYCKSNDLDPANAKAIQESEPLTTCKQLKSFMERVSYVRIFIPTLEELLEPFS